MLAKDQRISGVYLSRNGNTNLRKSCSIAGSADTKTAIKTAIKTHFTIRRVGNLSGPNAFLATRIIPITIPVIAEIIGARS
jgi:hypothetical protein